MYRKIVFAFEDADESKYDDYFELSEEVENVGNVSPDDYFMHTRYVQRDV